jgi:hypothetical protein
MTDVVGLYLNPPQKAIVLGVDEKIQIQALGHTQAGLPIKKGRCRTMTHDYGRNGTTTLFAALKTLEGKVIGKGHERHRNQESLKFLSGSQTLRVDRDHPIHSGKLIRCRQTLEQTQPGCTTPSPESGSSELSSYFRRHYTSETVGLFVL